MIKSRRRDVIVTQRRISKIMIRDIVVLSDYKE